MPVPRALFLPWSNLSPNGRGGLWLLASAATFAVMNGMIKGMGQDIHPFELAFFRCLFGFVAIAPFALRHGWKGVSTRRPGLHALRAMIGVLAMLSIFYAIANMPLAAATAIAFSKTLFMIVLAVLFLGETVRWRRWLATVMGFVGVVVMLHPAGGITFDLASGAALFHAICVGGVMVLVKKLTATEKPAAMVFTFTAAATIGTLIPSLFVWTWPNWGQLAVMAGIGGIASIAQYMAVRAYRVGEASAVTPMDYAQLPFAGVIGFTVFDEIPDPWTLAGAAIIVASTLYILHREARLRQGG